MVIDAHAPSAGDPADHLSPSDRRRADRSTSVTSLGITVLHRTLKAKISGEIWLDDEALISALPNACSTCGAAVAWSQSIRAADTYSTTCCGCTPPNSPAPRTPPA